MLEFELPSATARSARRLCFPIPSTSIVIARTWAQTASGLSVRRLHTCSIIGATSKSS